MARHTWMVIEHFRGGDPRPVYLVDFEVHPVVTSAEAAAQVLPES